MDIYVHIRILRSVVKVSSSFFLGVEIHASLHKKKANSLTPKTDFKRKSLTGDEV